MKRTLKLRFLSLFVAVLTAAAVIASPFAAVFAEDGSEEYINCTDTPEITRMSRMRTVSLPTRTSTGTTTNGSAAAPTSSAPSWRRCLP